MPAVEISDETLFQIGGLLHEARMTECYGNSEISSRTKWPSTFKDFRAQRQAGQPWIDVAIAQVRALVKNGIAAPYPGRSLASPLPSGNPAIDAACRISGGLGTAAQQPIPVGRQNRAGVSQPPLSSLPRPGAMKPGTI
jgi:hypothetical protein